MLQSLRTAALLLLPTERRALVDVGVVSMPLRSRLRMPLVLAKDACGVASLARTDWGISWSTLTGKSPTNRDTKGVLAWVPDGQTAPTVVDAALSKTYGGPLLTLPRAVLDQL